MKAAATQLKTEAKKIGNSSPHPYSGHTHPNILIMNPSSHFLPPLLFVIDLGDVEDMQDDLADLFEDMAEINDIMGR